MLSLPSRCKLTTFSSAPKVRTARAQFAGSLEDCHKHCGVQEGVGQTSRLYGAPVGHPYWSPDHDLRTSLCSSARQAREDAVLPLLETLLDLQLSRRHKVYAGERQAEFDAVECVPLRNKSQAYSVCLEVKNELGIAGASGIQCVFIYEKAVALPSVRTACHT